MILNKNNLKLFNKCHYLNSSDIADIIEEWKKLMST